MRKFWAAAFLILSFPALSRAQVLATASDALQSMNVPAGAKATALGGAFSSFADDSSAIFWNPAGMVWIPRAEIQTTYNQWFQDTFFQDLGAVLPTEWGAVGARLIYVNFGSFDARSQFGVLQGSITPQAWGGSLAVAGKFGQLGLGLTVKTYQESFPNYSEGGFGADAGALYRLGKFNFAAGVRNVGTASAGFGVPTDYYLGSSASLGSKASEFRLATDATFSPGGVVFHHGLEYGYHQTVFLRAGYQWVTQPVQDQDQAGFSGGVGVVLGDFQMDYSIVSYGDLGLTNRISVGYALGAEPQSRTVAAALPHSTVVPKAVVSPIPTPLPVSASATVVEAAPTPIPEVVQAEPEASMRVNYKKGMTAYKNENYAAAAKYLSMAAKTKDSKIPSWQYAEANAMLGIIYHYHLKTHGHLEKAGQYYHTALRFDPTNETAKKHLKKLKKALSSSR